MLLNTSLTDYYEKLNDALKNGALVYVGREIAPSSEHKMSLEFFIIKEGDYYYTYMLFMLGSDDIAFIDRSEKYQYIVNETTRMIANYIRSIIAYSRSKNITESEFINRFISKLKEHVDKLINKGGFNED